MAEIEDVQSWVGADAVDPDDEKLGRVDQLYLDGRTGDAMFADVKSGLIGKHHFVPLAGATFSRGHVRFAFTKQQVDSAPTADRDGVNRRDAAILHRHYGLDSSSIEGEPDDLCYESASAAEERRSRAEAQMGHADELERQARVRAGDSEQQAAEAERSSQVSTESAAEARRLHTEAEEARAAAERDLGG